MRRLDLVCALLAGCWAAGCHDAVDSARVTGPDAFIGPPTGDVVDPLRDGQSDGQPTGPQGDATPTVAPPPMPEPVQVQLDLMPMRAVYRPGQKVALSIDVLGDDGAPMADVALSFETTPADQATFEAEALELRFGDSEGALALTLCAAGPTRQACTRRDVYVDAGPPSLTVTAPQPGAELGGDGHDMIRVEGQVTDAESVIVLVNQVEAAVDGDTFFAEVPAQFGINALQVVAIDAFGQRSEARLDVLWAPAYAQPTSRSDAPASAGFTAARGMALRLKQAFFDDRMPHDVATSGTVSTDLAGVLELVIPSLNLLNFLPPDLGAGDTLTITGARILQAVTTIDVTNRGFELFVAIAPVRVTTAGSISVGDTTIDLAGTVLIDLATFADVRVRKDGADAEVEVTLPDIVTVVEDLAPDFADPAAAALFTLASSQLRGALEEAAHDALDDALREAIPEIFVQALRSIDHAVDDVALPLTAPFPALTLTLDGRLATLRSRFNDGLYGAMTMTSLTDLSPLLSSRGVAVARDVDATALLGAGVCGDGVVDDGEACDDGARMPGDGCDAMCRPEPGAVCHPDGTCEVVCPGGGSPTIDEASGVLYRYCGRATTFETAQAYCATRQEHLVRIDSEAELAVVSELGKNRDRWIDATYAAESDTWSWGDGRSFWQGGVDGVAIDGGFVAWAAQQPDVSDIAPGPVCGQLSRSGTWLATSCTAKLRFICEGGARCGDGAVAADEVCDDGNVDDLDGCTRTCAPSLFGAAPVEVVVPLPFVNALLHQLWTVGLLEIDVTGLLPESVSTLVDSAATHGSLPPIVRKAHPWEEANGALVLTIGQLELDVDILGTPTRYGIQLSAFMTVDAQDNLIQVDIAENPLLETWLIESATEPPAIGTDLLENLLLTQMWPGMRSSLQSVLNLRLPLPTIDLNAVAPGIGQLEMTIAPVAAPTIVDDALHIEAVLESALQVIQ